MKDNKNNNFDKEFDEFDDENIDDSKFYFEEETENYFDEEFDDFHIETGTLHDDLNFEEDDYEY